MKVFHYRRIRCVLEMISYVSDDYLSFISPEEVANYKNMVKAYLEKEVTYDQVRDIALTLRDKIPLEKYTKDYDFYAEFFSLYCGEEVLDWSYYQYFEITVCNLEKYISKELLLEMMKKHFNDILSQPVQRIIK